MNTHNDWQELLRYANEDVAKDGYELKVYKDEEGFYSLDIWEDGVPIEPYAENYYEDELEELVTDAWHYVKTQKP